ncbi:MAG: hypothetical protein WC477_06105 [Patescibacteria group bacterium]
MLKYRVTQEQTEFARNAVERFDFGKRGKGDGTKEQQFVGILGQTVIADLLKMNRPDGTSGFDNDIDFIINGMSVDVKTMGRQVEVQDHYMHNLVAYQANYDVDYYIFLSFNKVTGIMSICGYIPHEVYIILAKFHDIGTERTMADGRTFQLRAPCYELRQDLLNQVDQVSDLINGIKNHKKGGNKIETPVFNR